VNNIIKTHLDVLKELTEDVDNVIAKVAEDEIKENEKIAASAADPLAFADKLTNAMSKLSETETIEDTSVKIEEPTEPKEEKVTAPDTPAKSEEKPSKDTPSEDPEKKQKEVEKGAGDDTEGEKPVEDPEKKNDKPKEEETVEDPEKKVEEPAEKEALEPSDKSVEIKEPVEPTANTEEAAPVDQKVEETTEGEPPVNAGDGTPPPDPPEPNEPKEEIKDGDQPKGITIKDAMDQSVAIVLSECETPVETPVEKTANFAIKALNNVMSAPAAKKILLATGGTLLAGGGVAAGMGIERKKDMKEDPIIYAHGVRRGSAMMAQSLLDRIEQEQAGGQA